MRVAVCISGQPRTWKKCVNSWNLFFERFKKEHNIQVDFFSHLWDYNSAPNAVLKKPNQTNNDNGDYMTVKGEKLTDEEKNEIIETIKPKIYLFETEEVNKSKPQECVEKNMIYSHIYGDTILHWASAQFYSIMWSSFLKRKYEMENGFRYDMCIRMRCDLFFEENQIDIFFDKNINDILPIKHNTIYSCHKKNDMRLADVFFYSDSVTFDRICDFYRWIPMMGTRTFPTKQQELSTEEALYFYMKMLKINIKPTQFNPKIYRFENFLNLKEKIGLMEGLELNELI